MKCCAECIGDNGLRRALPSLSEEAGDCDYCQSKDVLVVEPSALAELFLPLVRSYAIAEEGKLLVQWLRDDWGMFEHERMDNTRAAALLAEILADGDIVRKLYTPPSAYETDSLTRWERLRDELMYGNRYFPKEELEEDRLEELLELLRLPEDDLPTEWYRARLMTDDAPYTIEQMWAPPHEIATHGRANPAGIPYLYLSTTPQTAVAEIRPHTGERACLATFSTPPDLRVVDLRSPRHSISPIDFGDEQKIGYLRSDLGFLASLGNELTRPVIPRSAAIDYVPSQYVCEFIKKCAYDGVIYKSSVGDGINMALFEQSHASAGSISEVRVTRVHVDVE